MRNIPDNFTGLIGICLLLALATVNNASAENLILLLKNGDRISGKLLSENTNQVVVSTSWAKELVLPVTEIQSRQTVVTSNAAPASIAGSAAVPPVAAVVAVVPTPKPAPKRSWHGKVDIGADLGFSEQNWQLYYAKAKVTYVPEMLPGEIKRWSDRLKNTFDFQSTYGRSDGVLTANRMDGSSKTDFDIGRRVFVYNLIGGGYDEIRKIDWQYEIGPGVGYHLITRSNFTMNIEAGLNYLVQRLDQPTGDRTVERFSLRLAEDATWTISKKLSLDEKFEFFPAVTDAGQFRLRFESNLRYSLWQSGAGQSLYLALSLLDIYESQTATGVENNDLQIRSSIGVSF